MAKSIHRCPWATSDLDIAYHDAEWGVPSHDDRHLFEMLVLEGAQAGLSWSTILTRRDSYREAFDGFDPKKVARFDEKRRAELLHDPGIIRNRAKIASAVANARAFLKVQEEFGSFDKFIWAFVGGKAIHNDRHGLGDIPTDTTESRAMSKELKSRGFSFVGPTICYALMQAVGMVDDHVSDCFRKGMVGD